MHLTWLNQLHKRERAYFAIPDNQQDIKPVQQMLLDDEFRYAEDGQ